MVITPAKWDTPHVLRAAAVADAKFEPAHPGARLTHAVSSADALYQGIAAARQTKKTLPPRLLRFPPISQYLL